MDIRIGVALIPTHVGPMISVKRQPPTDVLTHRDVDGSWLVAVVTAANVRGDAGGSAKPVRLGDTAGAKLT